MEQKVAHTPGPWLIEWNAAQGGEGHYITDSKDMVELSRIAAVLFHDDADGETRANAHLIAAAPQLLEALQTTAKNLRSWKAASNSGIKTFDSWLEVVEEAIAKAKGGAA